MFGLPPAGEKPPLDGAQVQRELHSISSAIGRVANAAESIAKDIAALRKMAEREHR